MKAIKITTDNEMLTVDIAGLDEMQEQVGGFIQIVRPYGFCELDVPDSKSLIMIVNEEGKLLDLEVNEIATDLYESYCDSIAGDVLIMAEGFVDGEPDIVGLTDEQVANLLLELNLLLDIDKTVRTCRVCGCTDDHACPGGCYWVEDDLCSECVGKE